MVLLTSLFGGEPPGAAGGPVDAGAVMTRPHQAMQQVGPQPGRRAGAGSARCRRRPPPAAFGFGVIAFGDLPGASRVGAWAAAGSWCPLLPILITVAVIRIKLRRGQRTAEGRAVCDQVEGFKTYLATAEADQLRFEEGEDIFSKYLPWAIIFELADRWAKICGDLVAMGRLPDATPYWYVGSYHMARVQHRLPDQQPDQRGHPGALVGSSGTGFGGGSSFGGGGFSVAAVVAVAAAAAGDRSPAVRMRAEPGSTKRRRVAMDCRQDVSAAWRVLAGCRPGRRRRSASRRGG